MSILTLDNVGLSNIDTATPTIYGIGLCYFDPSTETLREFTTDTTIPILPYEAAVRRFYILRDGANIGGNTLSLKVSTTSSEYIVKNTINGSLDEEAFASIASNNVSIVFLSQFSSGIIPVDIYIESLTYSLTNITLTIEMELQ